MEKAVVQKEIKVLKCEKCDEFGHIEKLNYPDKPELGSYYPWCSCEFGEWQKAHSEHRDMFCMARQGG